MIVAGDRIGLRRGAEVLDEGLVDLDPVERQHAQIGQVRVAGAEIVQRQPDAKVLQRAQHGERAAGVVDQHALGDFQLQPADAAGRGGRAPATDRLHQVGLTELHGREIDGEAPGLVPGHGLGDRVVEHPAPDRIDIAGALGQWDELGGRHLATSGVVPAQQRFLPDDRARLDVEGAPGSTATARLRPIACARSPCSLNASTRPAGWRRGPRSCGGTWWLSRRAAKRPGPACVPATPLPRSGNCRNWRR